jgi:hypothetical protein
VHHARKRRGWVRQAVYARVSRLEREQRHELNLSHLAHELGADLRTVRRALTELCARGLVHRIDARGGRGRGLVIKLGRFPHSPFLRSKICISNECAGGRRRDADASRLESTWPPTLADVRAGYQRAMKSPDSTKRFNGLLRAARRAAGFRGCVFRHSKLISAVVYEQATAIRKGSNREALLAACIGRIIQDPTLPPGTWPSARSWVEQTPEWFAHRKMELDEQRSDQRLKCARGVGHTAQSGRMGDATVACGAKPSSRLTVGCTLSGPISARHVTTRSSSGAAKQLPLDLQQWVERMRRKVT